MKKFVENDQRNDKTGQFDYKEDKHIDQKLFRYIMQATQPSMRRTRQDIDAYLAGFFDGEGHIGIYRDPRKNWTYYVDVGATQIDKRPLELLVKAYGGKIYPKRNGPKHLRLCSTWKCSGKNAMFALYRMLPWLIVKSNRARSALYVLQYRPHPMSGGQVSSHQKRAITMALQKAKIIPRKKQS